ncbi:MAG TPA: hypothetical protein VHB77_23010 [Planctomycetaceae bacterium]|nr:hypothetical protein [Planctomycetaceae bacterium]
MVFGPHLNNKDKSSVGQGAGQAESCFGRQNVAKSAMLMGMGDTNGLALKGHNNTAQGNALG